MLLKAAHLICKTRLNPFMILVKTEGCERLQTGIIKSFINVVKMKVFESGTPDLQNAVKYLYNPCQNGGLWKAPNWPSKTLYKRCENEGFWKRHTWICKTLQNPFIFLVQTEGCESLQNLHPETLYKHCGNEGFWNRHI